MAKLREEEEKKKKAEDEKKKKQREEEERQKQEDDKLKMEEKKKAQAHAERILREKEELKKIKEREAAREEGALKSVDLNTTYEKPPADKPVNKTLNKTQALDQSSQGPSSYDMTPAKHELPPEPLKDEDNYGLEDLNSEGETDDEDCPRKEVPKWAEGTNLRTALLKQCYMPPDLDHIFSLVEMPDLSSMFEQQRKRFFKRTSSACWEQPPESFKHSKRF